MKTDKGVIISNETIPKQRHSNIELFRIITMFLIVAHHYVVNSGLTSADGPVFSNLMSWRSIFLLIFGLWGKIGINCFVMITGYYMCKSKITLTKFCKILFEIMFYRIAISLFFWIFGYEHHTLSSLIMLLIPVKNINTGFTSAYLIFFLFIPFLNILLHHLNELQHIKLIILSGFLYIFLGSFPIFSVTMNYVSWFVILYFSASYIRMYPKRCFSKTKIWGITSLILIILCATSVIIGIWISMRTGRDFTYYFVADSNKILAFCSGISFFLFFKNINIKYSKLINTVASSTFGVLLIHANSDTMRECLWRGAFKNIKFYYSDYLPLHAFGAVIIVFVICVLIDQLRILMIEKPFFKFFKKHIVKIETSYHKFEIKLTEKLNSKKHN